MESPSRMNSRAASEETEQGDESVGVRPREQKKKSYWETMDQLRHVAQQNKEVSIVFCIVVVGVGADEIV